MAGCLGRVLVGGKDCGAGFALGPRLVVTANHVVRDRKDKLVAYVPAGGEAVGVERVQLDAAHDAAILRLMNEVEFLPTSVVVRGAGWRVESPPPGGNDPQLHGTVTTARMTIQNAQNQPVEVVQLQVDEQLGDFGGYSGSAVLDTWGRAVVALLVEQKPLRTPVVLGERRTASNVLYAVPIGDVVTTNGLSVRASTPPIPEAMDREQVTGHVFISYVREDSDQVDRLQGTLQSAGIPVWRDTAGLWPGEDWRLKIRRAITDNALVFIACFSKASLARGKSYQNEELTLAIEQLRLRPPDDPWLIPVRFDECEIADRDIGGGRTLASIQRVDMFGDKFDAGAARLIQAVMRILGHYYQTLPDRRLSKKQPAADEAARELARIEKDREYDRMRPVLEGRLVPWPGRSDGRDHRLEIRVKTHWPLAMILLNVPGDAWFTSTVHMPPAGMDFLIQFLEAGGTSAPFRPGHPASCPVRVAATARGTVTAFAKCRNEYGLTWENVEVAITLDGTMPDTAADAAQGASDRGPGPAGEPLSAGPPIVLRGGPATGHQVLHPSHPEDYVGVVGGVRHVWRHTDPQALAPPDRTRPVYDYIGPVE